MNREGGIFHTNMCVPYVKVKHFVYLMYYVNFFGENVGDEAMDNTTCTFNEWVYTIFCYKCYILGTGVLRDHAKAPKFAILGVHRAFLGPSQIFAIFPKTLFSMSIH